VKYFLTFLLSFPYRRPKRCRCPRAARLEPYGNA
jgi:hypothetical protein